MLGGGDDAHVEINGFARTDAGNGVFLQHAQQADLLAGGEVGDFVEKERTAVGLFQQAGGFVYTENFAA